MYTHTRVTCVLLDPTEVPRREVPHNLDRAPPDRLRRGRLPRRERQRGAKQKHKKLKNTSFKELQRYMISLRANNSDSARNSSTNYLCICGSVNLVILSVDVNDRQPNRLRIFIVIREALFFY